MAKTKLFSQLLRTWKQAQFAQSKSITDLQLPEFCEEMAHQVKSINSSRREFGRLLFGGVAGGVLWNTLNPTSSLAHPAPRESLGKKVVVVGGGVAGLATCYYLKKQGIKCSLFEASKRLGGRIFTQYQFNSDGMFVERGGELIDTNHEDLIELVEELGLETEDFLEGSTKESAVYHFGDQLLRDSDVLKAFGPFSRNILKSQETLMVDGEIQLPTYHTVKTPELVALDQLSLQSYLDSMDGNTMEWVEPWLRELISVAYRGEYGLESHEQSAINLVSFIGTETDEFKIFGESDEAKRIKGGNSKLINALIKEIEGTPIQLESELEHIKVTSSGAISLQFKSGSTTQEVVADHVVLAIPFTVLRRIPGVFDLPLSRPKRRAIKELGYGTNSKLMLDFTSKFWQTSSPFSTRGVDIYTDGKAQQFWETSRLQKGNSGVLTHFLGGERGATRNADQIELALSALTMIYGSSAKNQFTGKKVYHVWRKDPLFRGSYICPTPGQYTRLIGASSETELNGKLHFAGEHTSLDYGGFMNGAVESAKRVCLELTSDLIK